MECRPPSNGRRACLKRLAMLDEPPESASPHASPRRSSGGGSSLFAPFERSFDVVAECEGEPGAADTTRGGADDRSHRDQGPDDLVDLRTGGLRQIDGRLVGARRRVDGEGGPETDQACVFLSSPETSSMSWPMPSTDSRKPSSFSARLRSVCLYAAMSSSAASRKASAGTVRDRASGHLALHTRRSATSSCNLHEKPPSAGVVYNEGRLASNPSAPARSTAPLREVTLSLR